MLPCLILNCRGTEVLYTEAANGQLNLDEKMETNVGRIAEDKGPTTVRQWTGVRSLPNSVTS